MPTKSKARGGKRSQKRRRDPEEEDSLAGDIPSAFLDFDDEADDDDDGIMDMLKQMIKVKKSRKMKKKKQLGEVSKQAINAVKSIIDDTASKVLEISQTAESRRKTEMQSFLKDLNDYLRKRKEVSTAFQREIKAMTRANTEICNRLGETIKANKESSDTTSQSMRKTLDDMILHSEKVMDKLKQEVGNSQSKRGKKSGGGQAALAKLLSELNAD